MKARPSINSHHTSPGQATRAYLPDTRLRGLWLWVARLVWAAGVIPALGLIGAGTWRGTTLGYGVWASLSPTTIGGISSSLTISYYIALHRVITVGFFAIVALLFWQ